MIRYLTDLDSILDTRLGVLSRLNADAATHLVTHNHYWDRDYNDWEFLTNDLVKAADFDAAYRARGIEDLQASKVTGIPLVLITLFAEHNRQKAEGKRGDDVALEINLHPYELDYDELEELETILRSMFYSDLIITFCSRPMEELTPEVLKKHYNAVIMYDFHRWFKHHCQTLTKTPCPLVSMIAPRLFETNPQRLSMERRQEEVTAFRLMTIELLSVDFIDAACFCMLRPDVPLGTPPETPSDEAVAP